MERRSFLKQSCLFCLGASAGAALVTSLTSCASIPATTGDLVNGSVHLPLSAFSAGDLVIVQVPALDYDIGVRREGTLYTALLLKCTHAETQVTPTGDSYTCSAHGSWFDLEGKVRKGPARKDLARYPTVVENGEVLIRIS